MTAPATSSTPVLHRELVDGASYDLYGGEPGLLGLRVRDANGGDALVYVTADQLRRLLDDLDPDKRWRTPGTIGRAAALAGAVRRNFELLIELEKSDPAGAELIFASIANHLRSHRPMVLLAALVTP